MRSELFVFFVTLGFTYAVGESINRLNLGVLFRPIKIVHVQTASAKLVFVVDLPEKRPMVRHRIDCSQMSLNSPTNSTVASRQRASQTCRALYKPVQAIYKAQEIIVLAITRNIHELHEMINVTDVSDRSKRSWFPQIGYAYNQIFGLTDEYVRALEESSEMLGSKYPACFEHMVRRARPH